MATLVAKTYTLPIITGHRATCAGEQYTVQTPGYLDIVTVAGTHIACTCSEAHCDHTRAVLRQRAREASADARRAVYEATFDLSYGDNDAA